MRIRNQVTFFVIVLALFVAIGGIGIHTSSMKRLLKLEKTVQATWGDVEWRLEERNQFIEALIQYARSKAPDKEEVYKKAEALREKLSSIMKSGEPSDAIQTTIELSETLSKLMDILKAALEKTADAEFKKFTQQYSEIEARLIDYEGQYNQAVKRFNRFVRGFWGHFLTKKESPKASFP